MESSKILYAIESYIDKEGLNLHAFAKKCGLNRGTLSAIVNGNPPRGISVRELDLITRGMGLKEGELYNLYTEEYVMKSAPHLRRLRPFMLRCAETGKLDCLAKVLELLAEDLSYIGDIFAIAEQLYDLKLNKASAILYQCVIDSEKYNHSEFLAVSHYRLFQIDLGKDMETNLRAALRLEPYRRRLPVEQRLEVLVELAKIYFSIHKWDIICRLADELIEQSQVVYRERERRKKSLNPSRAEQIQLRKPLIHYFGQGYLCKATALQKMGRYEEARNTIDCYADLTWLEPANEEERQEVQKYKSWAKANSFTQEVLMGHQEMLDAYVDFLRNHPIEILPGLVTIVQSANKHNFSIDWIMNEFADSILEFDKFTDVVNMERRLRLAIQYSIYCVRRGRMDEAMESCLKALELSAATNSETFFGELIQEILQVRKSV